MQTLIAQRIDHPSFRLDLRLVGSLSALRIGPLGVLQTVSDSSTLRCPYYRESARSVIPACRSAWATAAAIAGDPGVSL